MDEALKQIFENEVLTEETKKAIAEAFKKTLDEARSDVEKAVRAEYAERYERDKVKIAEAAGKFVESRTEEELAEMQATLEEVKEQKVKYVEAQAAIKEQAKAFVAKKLAIFNEMAKRAFDREIAELHEEMQQNRKVLLQKMAENDAKAQSEREAFRKKAAGVLEHIIKVKMEKEFEALREDIRKAKENDFGRRIFEAFYAECRRSFFNSSAEHKALLKKISEQEAAHRKSLGEAKAKLDKALAESASARSEARKVTESAKRATKMGRLLESVPAGNAREKMKLILEATKTDNLDETFKKYAQRVLAESVKPQARPSRPAQMEVRTGGTTLTESADDDDQEIVAIRSRAGIGK